MIPVVQTISSFKNGHYYYPPAGVYKRSTLQVFSTYAEWYGQELGLTLFNGFHEATKEIKNYQPYQLAILMLRLMLHVVQNSEIIKKFTEGNRDLIKQLERQIIQMVINAKMVNGVEILMKIMKLDLNRLNTLRIRVVKNSTEQIKVVDMIDSKDIKKK